MLKLAITMNTTINPNDLLDPKVIEQLANQFFQALPGTNVAGLAPESFASGLTNPTPYAHPQQLDYPQSPASVTPNYSTVNSGIPKSVAGSGVSPSAVQNPSVFNINDPQTSLPDPHFQDGQVPKSVAGSGVSPSAVENPSVFNINDPQTSLPDPHFQDGQVPKSVAGSGVSPSAVQKANAFNIDKPQTSLPDPHFSGGQTPQVSHQQPNAPKAPQSDFTHLPFADQLQGFDVGLREALAQMNTFTGAPQLPINPSQESAYYFLSNQPHGLFALPSTHAAFNPFAEKSRAGNQGFPAPPFDVNLIKKDFPILQERVNGRPLIWLDNAATTQKPQQVIDRISYFYEHENSNIHRAAHELAARATDAYEDARKKVQGFLNAGSVNEIVFVRGTTEAINLVAKSWGEQNLRAGDEIILSNLEHHANIVPWQQLAKAKDLVIRVIPVDDDGQILLEEYAKLLNTRTKLVSFTQVSNALGTITPARQIIEMAHQAGAKVLLDGAQSVSHMRVDVRALNPDWFVFSGHKVFGPTGIGVLYGKEELLNATQPWQGGGNMIVDVTFEHTTYHQAPGRFEAGTGNIADAVGLGAAIDYVTRIGMDLIGQYEHYLLLYATKFLKEVPGLRLVGTAAEKASVLSFTLAGYTNDQVGQALNQEGIAVRTGHHCAQPILRRFGMESTVRPSLAFYNTCADVDTLVGVLHRLAQGNRK
jgi:cysteine desulfurase/selenocysteine lyase